MAVAELQKILDQKIGMGMVGKMKLMKNLMSGNLSGLGAPGGPMIRTKKSGWMAPKDRNKKKKRR